MRSKNISGEVPVIGTTLVLVLIVFSAGCVRDNAGNASQEVEVVTSVPVTSVEVSSTSLPEEVFETILEAVVLTTLDLTTCDSEDDCGEGEVCSNKGCLSVAEDDVFDVGDVHVWRIRDQYIGYLYFQNNKHESRRFPGRVDITFNDWLLLFDEEGNSNSTNTPLIKKTLFLNESRYRFLSMRETDGTFHQEWVIVLGPINASDFNSQPQSGIGSLDIVYTNLDENYSIEYSSLLFLLLEDEDYEKNQENLLSSIIMDNRDALAYEILTNELKNMES